jgi:dihydropteroate synthase
MKIGNKEFKLGERTFVVGILNATPDSFSDGGKYNEVELAVKRAEQLILDGADIIDIGGESTKPNFEAVGEQEEIDRVVPIIKAIKAKFDIPISIDTYKANTAKAAIEAGADMINDIWGFKKDKEMAKVAAKYQVPCILMHNRESIPYSDIMKDLMSDLIESINIALEAGVKRENIILDPGIGFAKTYEENLIVMNNIEFIKSLELPILLGTSRKSMIGIALDLPVEQRVEGTLATTVVGIIKGCEFIRVHDVMQNKRVCVMTDAIINAK